MYVYSSKLIYQKYNNQNQQNLNKDLMFLNCFRTDTTEHEIEEENYHNNNIFFIKDEIANNRSWNNSNTSNNHASIDNISENAVNKDDEEFILLRAFNYIGSNMIILISVIISILLDLFFSLKKLFYLIRSIMCGIKRLKKDDNNNDKNKVYDIKKYSLTSLDGSMINFLVLLLLFFNYLAFNEGNSNSIMSYPNLILFFVNLISKFIILLSKLISKKYLNKEDNESIQNSNEKHINKVNKGQDFKIKLISLKNRIKRISNLIFIKLATLFRFSIYFANLAYLMEVIASLNLLFINIVYLENNPSDLKCTNLKKLIYFAYSYSILVLAFINNEYDYDKCEDMYLHKTLHIDIYFFNIGCFLIYDFSINNHYSMIDIILLMVIYLQCKFIHSFVNFKYEYKKTISKLINQSICSNDDNKNHQYSKNEKKSNIDLFKFEKSSFSILCEQKYHSLIFDYKRFKIEEKLKRISSVNIRPILKKPSKNEMKVEGNQHKVRFAQPQKYNSSFSI